MSLPFSMSYGVSLLSVSVFTRWWLRPLKVFISTSRLLQQLFCCCIHDSSLLNVPELLKMKSLTFLHVLQTRELLICHCKFYSSRLTCIRLIALVSTSSCRMSSAEMPSLDFFGGKYPKLLRKSIWKEVKKNRHLMYEHDENINKKWDDNDACEMEDNQKIKKHQWGVHACYSWNKIWWSILKHLRVKILQPRPYKKTFPIN